MKKRDIEKLNFDGWPLPDEYLIEIGRVSALWVTLENFLILCIGNLSGYDIFDPKPFILVNHSSFPQKIDILGSLCEQLQHQNPQLKKHKNVISKIRAAQTLRNRFLHNGMVPSEETGIIQMVKGSARGSLNTEVYDIEISDIRKASMAIHEAHLALHHLILGQEYAPVWER